MNWRRGFFRVWLLISGLYVLAAVVLFYSPVVERFNLSPALWGAKQMLMVDCRAEIRGTENTDFQKYPLVGYGGIEVCIYEPEKFRRLYPEYRDLSIDDIEARLNKRLNLPTPTAYGAAWEILRAPLGWTLIPPLALLLLGLGVYWSMAGFRRSEAGH